MGTAQTIFMLVYAISFGMNLMKHGEPKTGYHSIWESIISTIIVFTLLIWGGFFK